MFTPFVFKIFIILLLIAIIASLASGMFFLIHDKEGGNRVVKSVTVRVILSIALFLFLIIGYLTGMIQPHDINPTPPPKKEKALT